MLNIKPKIWLSIKDMLDEYPLSERQIRRRLSKTIISKNKIKEVKSRRGNPTKLYHFTITDELLSHRRKLSQKEKDKTIKWVNNHKWKIIGNIVPEGADIDVNITIIKEIFKDLKEITQKSHLKLFYSIEMNPEDNYYHTHFLIDSNPLNLTLNEIRAILEKYVGKNTSNERRIHIKKYNWQHGKGGSVYSSKRRIFNELLVK